MGESSTTPDTDLAGSEAVLSGRDPSSTSWTDQESISATTVTKLPPRPPDLYRHEIMPEVALSFFPYFQQTSNPFFGETSQVPIFLETQPVSNDDFLTQRRIQFDYTDRVTNHNTVSLLLNNRLVRKAYDSTAPVYKQILNWKLGQTFDVSEATKHDGDKYPWSNLYSLLNIRLEKFETNTEIRYYPYHGVTNTIARVRWMEKKVFVETSFAQSFTITQNVDAAGPTRQDDLAFSSGFNSRYLAFFGYIDFEPAGFNTRNYNVKSYGTQLNIKPPGNCWGIRFNVDKPVADQISFHMYFDYKFGGETT